MAEAQATLASPHGQQAAAFISLQNQLSETQTSLSGQSAKIHNLEDHLGGHETMRNELATIRASMQESKREMELFFAGSRGRQLGRGTESDDLEDDEDDARSVLTVTESDGDEARVRERRLGERERHRPRTPEPIMNGSSHPAHNSSEDYAKANEELVARIQTLSSEITDAVQLSRTLQSQHGEAMATVKILVERVGVLENGVASRVAETEQRWEVWRSKFEEGWKKERESWEVERERLRGVVREWEEASRRAHEEEEERELNERLSEDGFVNDAEEEIDQGGEEGEESEQLDVVDGWKEDLQVRKVRRRRPSHKATLAIRALKSAAGDGIGDDGINGAAIAEDGVPRLRIRRKGSELARSGSSKTFRGEKEDSSESGKESADTLKESPELEDNGSLNGKGGRQVRRKKETTMMQVSLGWKIFSWDTTTDNDTGLADTYLYVYRVRCRCGNVVLPA